MGSISLSLKLLTVATIILQKDHQHRENSIRSTFRPSYDFIVIGSGASGATVANRLAENHQTSVLLLEAGPPNGIPNDIPAEYPLLMHSTYDWNYTMEEQFVGQAWKDKRIAEYRGFVLGGSSSINGMVFNRGNRRDYDQWAREFGATGWAYSQVHKYFVKFENNTDPHIAANGHHGTNGPVQVRSIFN